MKEKIGYTLGTLSFCWIIVVGGVEIPEPFFKNALVVLVAVAVGIAGMLLSLRLTRD